AEERWRQSPEAVAQALFALRPGQRFHRMELDRLSREVPKTSPVVIYGAMGLLSVVPRLLDAGFTRIVLVDPQSEETVREALRTLLNAEPDQRVRFEQSDMTQINPEIGGQLWTGIAAIMGQTSDRAERLQLAAQLVTAMLKSDHRPDFIRYRYPNAV